MEPELSYLPQLLQVWNVRKLHLRRASRLASQLGVKSPGVRQCGCALLGHQIRQILDCFGRQYCGPQ